MVEEMKSSCSMVRIVHACWANHRQPYCYACASGVLFAQSYAPPLLWTSAVSSFSPLISRALPTQMAPRNKECIQAVRQPALVCSALFIPWLKLRYGNGIYLTPCSSSTCCIPSSSCSYPFFSSSPMTEADEYVCNLAHSPSNSLRVMLVNRVVTGNAFKTHRNAPEIVPLSREYNSVRQRCYPLGRQVSGANGAFPFIGRSRAWTRVGSSEPRSVDAHSLTF